MLDKWVSRPLGPLPLSVDASAWLHLTRCVAALMVLLGHWRAIFYVDYAGVASPSVALQAFYFLTGLGHQAVVIFFVLSGFFIGNVVIDASRMQRWSAMRYTVDRLSRLYVVLLPALLLCWVWDSSGIWLFGVGGIYGGQVPGEHVVTFSVPLRNSWTIFTGNFLFLQTIVVPPFGSNGPLWSLAYEFWYYAVFPLVWLGCSAARISQRVLVLTVAAGVLSFLGSDIALYFTVWLLGVWVSLVARRTLARPLRFGWVALALAFVVFIASLALARARIVPEGFGADFFVACVFAILMLVMVHARVGASFAMLSKKIAAFSYTLYLVHVPPLVFIAASMGGDYKYQPTAMALMSGVPALVLVIIWAWLVYQLTERHTSHVRQWVLEWFQEKR